MGTMVLMDVYETRQGKGIEPGSIRSLLIMEELPRPAANCAYADAISTNSNYVLHRILGTVPVAEDGSAHFKVPAGRPIFFIAQDEKGQAAKAMGSFTSVMPGEIVGCVGCHEQRTRTMGVGSAKMAQAMRRDPDAIQPVPDAYLGQALRFVSQHGEIRGQDVAGRRSDPGLFAELCVRQASQVGRGIGPEGRKQRTVFHRYR
jgi:hypothetical protein